MPYKDIKLTLLDNTKLLINPGEIMSIIEYSNCTRLNLCHNRYSLTKICLVKEKKHEIEKLIRFISEEEYSKNRNGTNGFKAGCIIFDELKERK